MPSCRPGPPRRHGAGRGLAQPDGGIPGEAARRDARAAGLRGARDAAGRIRGQSHRVGWQPICGSAYLGNSLLGSAVTTAFLFYICESAGPFIKSSPSVSFSKHIRLRTVPGRRRLVACALACKRSLSCAPPSGRLFRNSLSCRFRAVRLRPRARRARAPWADLRRSRPRSMRLDCLREILPGCPPSGSPT
jgi:hypothetical protein